MASQFTYSSPNLVYKFSVAPCKPEATDRSQPIKPKLCETILSTWQTVLNMTFGALLAMSDMI